MTKIRFGISRYSRSGFTIVELLIVIVVIAILAGLAIVAYNGIQRQTVEASLKSDVRNASGTLQSDQVLSNYYPGSLGAANGGVGVRASGSNTFVYSPHPGGFCISASSTQAGAATQYYSTRTNKVQAGSCLANIETYAGSGTAGQLDGFGTAAQLSSPRVITSGPNGMLYMAESSTGFRIKSISTITGQVLTIATMPTYVYGLVFGPDGYIYASSGNRVYRVTTGGTVTAYVGSGTGGAAEGIGTAAQLSSPQGLAFDSSGNLFIVDSGNYRIRRVAPSGQTYNHAGTVWGYQNGDGTSARFGASEGLAIDSANNLYVVDSENQRIRKVTPAGYVSSYSGSGTSGNLDGDSATARFNSPSGIAIDSIGVLYVADANNRKIRKITTDGAVSSLNNTTTTGFQDGLGDVARFSGGMWSATLGPNNIIYAVDSVNSRIRAFTQP